eukprot:CAMPEP_0202454392 /NCGR_PEP_ID=MMETSP1360-20130828/12142_1 /ASSEMBLY_ACC=CAM_ASM_000848 /TAXON_ID=515479 /ORGANISM="Licmophora paradoxa, Strain CCMP2313" /LENGTH=141 /DNA_ID=CAMNT_0049073697 /DNA_START=41 /DNA_END=466 /DNA_ORIENTATION=-
MNSSPTTYNNCLLGFNNNNSSSNNENNNDNDNITRREITAQDVFRNSLVSTAQVNGNGTISNSTIPPYLVSLDTKIDQWEQRESIQQQRNNGLEKFDLHGALCLALELVNEDNDDWSNTTQMAASASTSVVPADVDRTFKH